MLEMTWHLCSGVWKAGGLWDCPICCETNYRELLAALPPDQYWTVRAAFEKALPVDKPS